MYDLRGACDVLMLHMDSVFLGNVALEAMDMDPSHTEVSEQFALRDGLIAEIGAALIGIRAPNHPADHLYAESLINTLALHMLRRYGVLSPRSERLHGRLPPNTLRLVKDHIQHHPGNDLTLAELSRLANLSAAHFATLFKASTGQSVHQYVLQQRIAEAKRLLVAGHLSLAEIADTLGFADQSHFTRLFKRIVGVTPGELQRHRKFVQNLAPNIQDQDR
jgi:AraC family transcriptional regulator